MKFNFLSKVKKLTVNYEGAKAYKMTPELELYTAVVTTGLSNSFYESGKNRLTRVQQLLQECNPEFVAKLAVYARSQMNLRSIPLVLVVELAKASQGSALVSRTVNHVIQRADEITELLAYYQMANARSGVKKLNRLSKQLQKGLAVSFNNFDEYQFAKYNRSTDVKLRDALFLVHPKAKDENQQLLFNKIAKNELAVPYTWETALSALGKQGFTNADEKQAAVAAKWAELIESKKLGYMALLRNLRNILDADVSVSAMQHVCNRLANERAVANSRQLPFRFLAAYREVLKHTSGYAPMVLNALEKAVMHSAQNIQGFDYNTKVVIACDVSGSMQQPVSKNSKIMLYDVGLMLGMLLQSRCKNVVSGMFGDRWKIISMPQNNVLSNVMAYYKREGEVGYATNGHKVIDDLYNRRYIADKVMLFTDVQMYSTVGLGFSVEKSWDIYKTIAPNAKLYVFDLAGHGKAPLDTKRNDVHLIAGWSDKIFDVLYAIENGSSAIERIAGIEL